MYIVSAQQMRALDAHTIETIGIPSAVLMENAAQALAAEVAAVAERLRLAGERRNGRWLVLAGKGNNGGDGLAAARILQGRGIAADVLLAEPPNRLGEDAALQYGIAVRLGIVARVFADSGSGVAGAGSGGWDAYDGIVDALLGTGTRGAPREPYAAMIRRANASGRPIVAADIPSGLDADTGETHEPCIRAERTVTFAFLKRGLTQYPGAAAAGAVSVRPIGVPEPLAAAHGVNVLALTERTLRERLGVDVSRSRAADAHKGTYGHALVAAGTPAMSGAGLLCSRAALRAGCGLATWALPAGLAPLMPGALPEAMLAAVPDDGAGGWTASSAAALLALAESRDALAVGPGMGRFAGDTAWLHAVWTGWRGPLALDADALNMLADAPDFASWPRRAAATVLTPHPGEMARLAGIATRDVQRDRIGLAARYASEHGVTLVLKGAGTVVAAADGSAAYVNGNGNAGMATGGSGDVLTGIIVGLLAQGMSAVQAACFGVWLHGAAGDRAAAKRAAPASLLASDIIEEL
ncbi:NAD(P)H-hydrate dehydratase [Paenibacillus cymbidii]|uniref:NAD(P)H-hydrate dehydratase n=1 Tax=Paenibacillus cymbidii TaxID=1639034 RepID=UPI001080E4CD|nr:NAD(P)H-hydrate dehydratase [Paenibacillus cymbidii]